VELSNGLPQGYAYDILRGWLEATERTVKESGALYRASELARDADALFRTLVLDERRDIETASRAYYGMLALVERTELIDEDDINPAWNRERGYLRRARGA
jgi:hypothetical protein